MLCWKDMLTNLSCSLLDQSWFAARPFLLALWFEFKACSLLPNSMAEKRRSWISTRLTCGPFASLVLCCIMRKGHRGVEGCWSIPQEQTQLTPGVRIESTRLHRAFWVMETMGLHGDQASSRYVVQLPEGSTKRLGSILEWWRSWDQSILMPRISGHIQLD